MDEEKADSAFVVHVPSKLGARGTHSLSDDSTHFGAGGAGKDVLPDALVSDSTVAIRQPDGTELLRNGKGADNNCMLKSLVTAMSCGLNLLCCKLNIVGPEQYIITRNLQGETAVLGAGERGAIYAWKLVLSSVEVRHIAEDEPIERGPLKVVPVPAGHYRMAYNVVSRQPLLLKAGLHVIDDAEIGLTRDAHGNYAGPVPVTARHIRNGTTHIIRVADGEVLCCRLDNKAYMIDGPRVVSIDDATFEFVKLAKCTEPYIFIDDIHRFAIEEGTIGAIIADGVGRLLTSEDRGIIHAKEIVLVTDPDSGSFIYSIDTERIRAGNLARIKIPATMVGIGVDGEGSLRILPTGVHEFRDDPDFRYYGSISSEQHPMKVCGLRETAGDSGEASFDVTFAFRVNISDAEAVKKVYHNLGKNAAEVAEKVRAMVVQKALSAFGHCDLGARQETLESRGISDVTHKSAEAGSVVAPTFDAAGLPPAAVSVKDILVGELMNDSESSLRSVLQNRFGVTLDYIGIEQLAMPEALAAQMQKQAIATAAGRAHVLEAEAEAAAAKARAQGEREVLQIKARTDKSLAEIRAEAKLIGARAEADAIREVGAARKEALSDLAPEAVQVMIAREAGEAIREGHTTLIGQGVDSVAAMMGVRASFAKAGEPLPDVSGGAARRAGGK